VLEWPILGLLEPGAVFGLNVEFRKAYATEALQIWYFSIDIHSIVLHVKFEDWFSISVLKNRATSYKDLLLEIVKF
jgi:hypothetical protein